MRLTSPSPRATELNLSECDRGEPNIPTFKGAEGFEGTMTHSSRHKGGEGWSGKKAVVVGCCNSGMRSPRYGGSTTILVVPEGKVVWDADLVEADDALGAV